jgi:hypothetical protein
MNCVGKRDEQFHEKFGKGDEMSDMSTRARRDEQFHEKFGKGDEMSDMSTRARPGGAAKGDEHFHEKCGKGDAMSDMSTRAHPGGAAQAWQAGNGSTPGRRGAGEGTASQNDDPT